MSGHRDVRGPRCVARDFGCDVRPDSQRLERVLRNESAVLAYDHDCRDSGSLETVALHSRLDVDSGKLTDGPLAVVAARAASRAACLERGDDSVLVVRGNFFVVVHGLSRLLGDGAGLRSPAGPARSRAVCNSSGSRVLAGRENSWAAVNIRGRYVSTHQAPACLEIARKARGGNCFGCRASCSAILTISGTRTTIAESDAPRSCSAATVAFTESRSVLMKAKSPSSSLETKSSGCPATAIGFFMERPGGENGVARSAGMLPQDRDRSDVRAGGNVPHIIT